jgi:hypothetical protein
VNTSNIPVPQGSQNVELELCRRARTCNTVRTVEGIVVREDEGELKICRYFGYAGARRAAVDVVDVEGFAAKSEREHSNGRLLCGEIGDGRCVLCEHRFGVVGMRCHGAVDARDCGEGCPSTLILIFCCPWVQTG